MRFRVWRVWFSHLGDWIPIQGWSLSMVKDSNSHIDSVVHVDDLMVWERLRTVTLTMILLCTLMNWWCGKISRLVNSTTKIGHFMDGLHLIEVIGSATPFSEKKGYDKGNKINRITVPNKEIQNALNPIHSLSGHIVTYKNILFISICYSVWDISILA